MAFDLGERIRAAFTENLNLKVLSLGFALILYSLVHGAQDAQRNVSVNVLALLPSVPTNRVLVSQMPSQVRMTLRGPRPVLDDLRAEDIGNVQVDVHEGTEKRIVLEPAMVHVPPGVRVEQIDPPFIDLQWEDKIVRDVPVQVGLVGVPAPGFVVHGQVVAEPPTVRVRGPQSEVALLQHVRADAFDVQGLTEGKYARQLALDRPHGRVTVDLTSVQVVATVAREMVERPFARVPVVVVGPPKARTQPVEVDVRLTCPPEIGRALRPEQVVAKVEVDTKDPAGSVSRPVIVALDPRCQAQTVPKDVIVRW